MTVESENKIIEKILFVKKWFEKILSKIKNVDRKHFVIVTAAAIIAILVLCFSVDSGYNKQLKNLAKLFEGKSAVVEKMAPREFWEYVDEEYDMTVEDVEEEIETEIEEDLEEEIGEKIRVSYEVTDKKELSQKKVRELAEELKGYYEIPKRSVKKAYKLEVDFEFSGEYDTEDDTIDILAVKIDKSWYLLYETGDFLIEQIM